MVHTDVLVVFYIENAIAFHWKTIWTRESNHLSLQYLRKLKKCSLVALTQSYKSHMPVVFNINILVILFAFPQDTSNIDRSLPHLILDLDGSTRTFLFFCRFLNFLGERKLFVGFRRRINLQARRFCFFTGLIGF